MAANTKTSQRCEVRLGFETSENQAARIEHAATIKDTSVAEFIRTAIETRLKRMGIVQNRPSGLRLH